MIVVLGTEPNEWVTGYDSVSRFIYADWKNWGNVRLDTEHPVVCTSGNVAWLATPGVVELGRNSRPLRFTAVLVLDDSKWTFRHVQFQWDDRQANLTDFLHIENYSAVALAIECYMNWATSPREVPIISVDGLSCCGHENMGETCDTGAVMQDFLWTPAFLIPQSSSCAVALWRNCLTR